MSSLQLTGGDLLLRGACQNANDDPVGRASAESMMRERIMNYYDIQVVLYCVHHSICDEPILWRLF